MSFLLSFRSRIPRFQVSLLCVVSVHCLNVKVKQNGENYSLTFLPEYPIDEIDNR